MSRYIVPVLLALALSYCGYTTWQDIQERKGKSESRTAIAEAKESALNAEISRRAALHNAFVDWPTRLAGDESIRISKVLTAEVQELWMAGQPILFVGQLDDISHAAAGFYLVNATYDGLGTKPMFLAADLRVSVECTEQLAASIVASHRNTDQFSITPDIALVVQIYRVTQLTNEDSDGISSSVITGFGTCLDIVSMAQP